MKLVVFDLDDTLILSKIDYVLLWRELLKEPLGREIEYFETVLAPTSTDKLFCEYFLKNPQEVEKCLEKLTKFYLENVQNFWVPEGVRELSENLSKQKIKLAIFSARDKVSGIFLLKHFCLETYFDFLIFSEDVKKQKPNGEGLQKILEHFKVLPEETLYVGDTKDDLEAAKSQNVEFFRVSWFRKGQKDWQNLSKKLLV